MSLEDNRINLVPKSEIEEALEDIKAGRVTKWESVEQMFKTLLKD